jgi:hypothetical protein
MTSDAGKCIAIFWCLYANRLGSTPKWRFDDGRSTGFSPSSTRPPTLRPLAFQGSMSAFDLRRGSRHA